jgi:urea ABC transporter permease protein UrtC
MLILLIFPMVTGSYHTSLLARYLVFGILAMSFDLLWGYAGIMNFAQAAFFGMGAYTLGLVLKHMSFPGVAEVALMLSVLVPVLVSLVLGYFLFYGRVGGIYLAIVTLAISVILQQVIVASIHITGGLNGLRGYPNPRYGIPGIWEVEASGSIVPYYMAVAGALLAFLLARKVVTSSFGRVLEAVGEKEERVEFLGYDVPRVKMVVFAVACGLAGLAGALYVPLGFVSPELLGLGFATNIIVWVAIGGRGTLIGAFVGALFVSYLQLMLSGVAQELWFLLMGVFFIAVVMFQPDGLLGYLRLHLGRARP